MKISYKSEGGVEIKFEDYDTDYERNILLTAVDNAKNIIKAIRDSNRR